MTGATAARLDPFERGAVSFPQHDLSSYLPPELKKTKLEQTDIPAFARRGGMTDLLERSLRSLPTKHYLICGDARQMQSLSGESVHLVLTSPPYWTLKEYDHNDGQLGHVEDYDQFVHELERVWQRAFEHLVPGGRLICVVGDVCLSRRQNGGRHTVVPLHASIQESCRKLGFDNLAPIIWHKIANAVYEVSGPGGFLGKPYEPNSVIKNDVEYILMFRKPGGYRKPDGAKRLLSIISAENYQNWFQQVWTGLTRASTRNHPAPYPLDLAVRLIRMFSFAGDVVLDPFSGTGTTSVAAALYGRNSVGYEISGVYHQAAVRRFEAETGNLFHQPLLESLVEG
ncbi:MAG TPA: site-specific DNA-methyltransferase [Acidobacteriaceae bacterium]|nr:site-specific DNA-methyltransferase [Acidobacteriaceae bacterium]